jgi:hypothetical protein
MTNHSRARRMVEDFYLNEEDGSYYEAFNMKFTASGTVSDITMLDAIAARFNTTRSALVSEILHDSVLEMYFGLNIEDKKNLSSSADLETTKILDKKGVKQESAGFGLEQGEVSNDDMSWRGYYAAILKSEEDKKNADA